MNKAHELLSPTSCFNRAAPDEPIFVLRANDPLAPDIVREWARQYLTAALAKGVPDSRTLCKYQDAINCAKTMERFSDELRICPSGVNQMADAQGKVDNRVR
jgi:hypothetical protein